MKISDSRVKMYMQNRKNYEDGIYENKRDYYFKQNIYRSYR